MKYLAILLFFLPYPILAADLRGEIEAGFHENGESYSVQIFWKPSESWVTRVRYDHHLDRSDFAIGPTFNFAGIEFAALFGGTTDDETMFLGSATAKVVSEIKLTGIVNTKFGDEDSRFLKFYAGKDKLFLRLSHLKKGSVSRPRVGFEWRDTSGIFIAPYYNPDKNEFGAHGGWRLKF